jgi:hypothetical protein
MFMKFKFILLALPFFSYSQELVLSDYVGFHITTHEKEGLTKARIYPLIKEKTLISDNYRRFEYLLYQYSNPVDGNNIKALYPDTVKMKETYLTFLSADKNRTKYFKETLAPFMKNSVAVDQQVFTTEELMDVSSKFFYCTQVMPDNKIRHKTCIGFNGIAEAQWEKDYMLLEAFCYEAIFTDLFSDASKLAPEVQALKEALAVQKFSELKTQNEYLLDVRLGLFEALERNELLKSMLLSYYQENEDNLAFKLE